MHPPRRVVFGALAFVLALLVPLLGACTSSSGSGTTVKVGSKNFTEEKLVGEMYALLLEDAGVKVERKLNLGTTDICHTALTKGDIDLYPEYTGTGLTAILNKPVSGDQQAVYKTVSDDYKSQFKITWLDPAPMDNTNALAMTQDGVKKLSSPTLTELSQKAPELRLAAVSDFVNRPDALPGLQKAYGGFQFKEVKIFAPDLKYKALLDGQADVAVAFSTDGDISGNNLVVLQDDKKFFPPYQIAPVVRDDTLGKEPKIKDALNKLAPKLTNETVSSLNWEVDGKKREYADVAKEFLKKQGLIK